MLLDPNHPFFNRLWVRLLCVAAPLAWACVEYANGAIMWSVVFAAAAAYLAFALFVQRKG